MTNSNGSYNKPRKRHFYDALNLAFLLICVMAVMATPQNAPITTSSDTVLAHSGFNVDDEGWKVVDVPDNGPYNNISNPISPTYQAEAGNPGGCVSSTDPNGVTFYWQAPSAFLGNKLAAYGGSLTFDLRTEGGSIWYDADVVLIGGGKVLVYDIPEDPTATWANYRVTLREGDWKISFLNGETAAASDMQAVLSDLTTLLIRGEYWWGGDYCLLDNVDLIQPGELTSLNVSLDPGTSYRGALSGIKLNYNLTGAGSYHGLLTPDAEGKAVINTVIPGTYTLTLTGSPWLRRVIPGIQVGSVNAVNVSLCSGDADGDGQVNLFDMVVLDIAFGSSDAMADLDGDGHVNLFDYVVIDMNFGAKAD